MIHVVSKRWFQKSYGNTYHSVRIYLDGKEIIYVPFKYGYETQYKVTAHDALLEAGYDVPSEYYDFIRSENVTFSVTDVERKRDL